MKPKAILVKPKEATRGGLAPEEAVGSSPYDMKPWEIGLTGTCLKVNFVERNQLIIATDPRRHLGHCSRFAWLHQWTVGLTGFAPAGDIMILSPGAAFEANRVL